LARLKTNESKIDTNQEWNNISELLESDTTKVTKVIALQPKRSYAKLLSIAAAAAVLLVAGWWLFNLNSGSTDLIVSSEDSFKEQKLSDGTQVNLNQHSTIGYADAADGTRQVVLDGDAFFDVKRDETRPFVISADEVAIKVLGTSFYVDARDDQDQIQVIVASGTVAVEVDNKKVILEKGDIGVYTKSNQQLVKKQNQDVNYMAWKTGKLVYEEALLGKVIFDLNRTFHADIRLEPAGLKNCTLTAVYENQTLESILVILEKTLNLNANSNGERIVLSGSPCE
ncbi:MAG: FecR family protein, partial [Saprospiraceae bacterium]